MKKLKLIQNEYVPFLNEIIELKLTLKFLKHEVQTNTIQNAIVTISKKSTIIVRIIKVKKIKFFNWENCH